MPSSFEKAIALERVEDDVHRLVIPDGWQQGRGAFGGLVLGILMEAMTSRESAPIRAARAFTGDLCGPALAEESRITTRILRRGNNQTNVAATLEQDGSVVAHATCVLAAPRKVRPPPAFVLEPPARVPYASVEPLVLPPSESPVFTQHYEYRVITGQPFRAAADAVVTGWLKERVPLSRVTASSLLGRLDAFWPAIFAVESAPRPIATVSFLAEILCDPSTLDPAAPLFYRARVVAQSAGYFVEMRELWSGDVPVALNQQSLAMLG
jgi:hypothetical protein